MDPVHFSGKEVLDMAVRIEENGLKFYTDAAKASRSTELKSLFKTLADEENQHIKVFTGFKKMAAEGAPEGYDPYTEDAALYLDALADSEVFKNPDKGAQLASKVRDENEALETAIGMEKDSILFYYELLNMIRDKDRKIMDNLIDQEKSHLRKLTELQKKLKAASK